MIKFVPQNVRLLYYKGRRRIKVPVTRMFKASFLVTLAPFMAIGIFTIFGHVKIYDALAICLIIFIISMIFVTPYLRDLSTLTYYVEQLSLDRKATAPPLSFLNNVEELSEAVEKLHGSWEYKKTRLESAIAEIKVLIDSLPDILVMLDSDLNIARTNREAKTIFGHGEAKNIFGDGNDKIKEILAEREVDDIIKSTLEDGMGRHIDYSAKEPVFRDYTLSVERLPFYQKGDIALVVVLHDITELKRTEKTMADFVANASHEIRTPLTSIVGFIETLQGGAKNDPDALNKFLDIMSSQADRISRLVRDLLSLSKLEASTKNLPDTAIGIKPILEHVKGGLTWSAEQKNISIILEYKNDIPNIIGDSGQLTQVFENLLSNAIKYSHKDSTIKIIVDLLRNKLISRRIGGVNQYISNTSFVSVAFHDVSEGIATEHLPRLTERFYRVDTARSREIGGTGLGLAIVKHILDRHNGFLKIESTLGKGSIFSVMLPVN